MMTKFSLFLAAALMPATAAIAVDTPVSAQMAPAAAMPVVGKMMYSTGGKKLAPVYKIDASGAPQILLDGRLLTIPAATLTQVDGRTETSLTRKDIMSAH